MKLKKLRKIFRILFPKKYSRTEAFELNLNQNNLIANYIKDGDLYKVKLTDGNQLFLRDYNYSDYDVFKQIFNFKEYQIILDLFRLNTEFSNQKIVIDAGANIGLTTLFFANSLLDYKIFSIEPSFDNFKMCERNIQNSNVKLYERALSEKENMRYSVERNFRDKKDWSITTKSDVTGAVIGISVSEIIKDNGLKYISLLKIDIEGAERFIFNMENDLSYLKITQIVALEIHDEFNIRNSIENILVENNFLLFNSGELTIGINKNFTFEIE
jgi:FkbM family methyltransferase